MPPKKRSESKGGMESKVAAMEAELTNLKSAMMTMQIKNEENQAQVMELLTKVLDKKMPSEGEGGDEKDQGGESARRGTRLRNQKDAENRGTSSRLKKLQGEPLEEFKQSVKKIELPMFDGNDPAGWITRAEIYFHVQDTHPEV